MRFLKLLIGLVFVVQVSAAEFIPKKLSQQLDVHITNPLDGNILQYDNATSKWINVVPSGGGGSSPFTDATAILKNSADATKLLRFSLSGFTTGTTRVITPPNANTSLPVFSQTITVTGPSAARTWTVPDADFTIARTDAANTFTGTQTIGALVATTLNGNTFTTGTGVLTIAAGKTFTSSNTLTLTGTDGSSLAIGTGGTLGTAAYISSTAGGDLTGTLPSPTLATVNASPGAFGSATKSVTATVNAKGLITSLAEQTVTPAESSVTFTDITTGNASTTKHGYVPKLPNDATQYYDGTGAFSVPSGNSPPFIDSTAILKGSGDATKLLRIEVDGITTATTRVWTAPNSDTSIPIFPQIITLTGPTAARTWTAPDANITLARIDAAQTFTGNQTFGGFISLTGTAGAGYFNITNQASAPSAPSSGATNVYAGSSGQLNKKNSSNTVTTFAELESAGQTFTAANIFSAAGAASTPAIKMSGTPYSAGTATTNFPLFYLNDSTATPSTTLSPNGTHFGINSHTSADFINCLKDGGSVFKVSNSGAVTASNGITSSGNFTAGGTNGLIAGSASFYTSGTSGLWILDNASFTGASGRLCWGTSTNSSPSISRVAVNGLEIKSSAGTDTYNDATTANSGTVADRAIFNFPTPTLTSTGTSVTNTVASNVRIAGAPIASTNTTNTTPYALYVVSGVTKLSTIVALTPGSVASLPSTAATGKVSGAVSVVNDALAPTYSATIVGGGAVTTLVLYDGTNWVAH